MQPTSIPTSSPAIPTLSPTLSSIISGSATNTFSLSPVPDTREAMADWLVNAWRNGEDPAEIKKILAEQGQLKNDIEWLGNRVDWVTTDLDGDNQAEWLIALYPYSVNLGAADGVFWIINHEGITYEVLPDNPNRLVPVPIASADLTGDGLPEVITKEYFAGTTSHTAWYQVLSTHHGPIKNIVQRGNQLDKDSQEMRSVDRFDHQLGPSIEMTTPDLFEIVDKTGDGLPDLLVGLGGAWSLGAKNRSYRQEVWAWDGQGITLANIEWEEQ
ncbi:MAG: hypothetical protein AAF485_15260 [Chloroflexota bacterium]